MTNESLSANVYIGGCETGRCLELSKAGGVGEVSEDQGVEHEDAGEDWEALVKLVQAVWDY